MKIPKGAITGMYLLEDVWIMRQQVRGSPSLNKRICTHTGTLQAVRPPFRRSHDASRAKEKHQDLKLVSPRYLRQQ